MAKKKKGQSRRPKPAKPSALIPGGKDKAKRGKGKGKGRGKAAAPRAASSGDTIVVVRTEQNNTISLLINQTDTVDELRLRCPRARGTVPTQLPC